MKFKQIYGPLKENFNFAENFNENNKIIQLGIEFPSYIIHQNPLVSITIKKDRELNPYEFYITEKDILELKYLRLLVNEIESITISKMSDPYFILNVGYE